MLPGPGALLLLLLLLQPDVLRGVPVVVLVVVPGLIDGAVWVSGDPGERGGGLVVVGGVGRVGGGGRVVEVAVEGPGRVGRRGRCRGRWGDGGGGEATAQRVLAVHVRDIA